MCTSNLFRSAGMESYRETNFSLEASDEMYRVGGPSPAASHTPLTSSRLDSLDRYSTVTLGYLVGRRIQVRTIWGDTPNSFAALFASTAAASIAALKRLPAVCGNFFPRFFDCLCRSFRTGKFIWQEGKRGFVFGLHFGFLSVVCSLPDICKKFCTKADLLRTTTKIPQIVEANPCS